MLEKAPLGRRGVLNADCFVGEVRVSEPEEWLVSCVSRRAGGHRRGERSGERPRCRWLLAGRPSGAGGGQWCQHLETAMHPAHSVRCGVHCSSRAPGGWWAVSAKVAAWHMWPAYISPEIRAESFTFSANSFKAKPLECAVSAMRPIDSMPVYCGSV